MIYLRNSGIEICMGETTPDGRVLYFLSAEPVKIEPPLGLCVVMVYPYEWSSMMTPWKGDCKGMEKTGEGDEFSRMFAEHVEKPVERELPFKVTERGIAGYSLGGLQALYMMEEHDEFNFCGSVSGSLWYPDAVDFFTGKGIPPHIRQMYFSIGDKEDKTSHPLRSKVRKCTDIIAKHAAAFTSVEYEINPGGHFTCIDKRINRCAGIFAENNI
ncbi:MAG: alpha/beta hydrolase-fold protein [Butyrivibrio sp.]